MMDWTDKPRTRERVALVGMNPRTKDKAPFSNPDYEIWSLNEHSMTSVPRVDRLFQLHPRWDWNRVNNASQPNHPLYLRNQSGPCYFCKGVGVFTANGENKKCPYCENGTYTPPESRKDILIYMQKDYADVPGCVALPFEEMVRNYCWDNIPYFTSTFSYMLVMAMMLGFPHIEIYGFEMESNTEYFHQRVNAEYWIGVGRAKGFDITAPGATILKGELYAFSNPLQGFRQQLEMRKHHLQAQYQQAVQVSNVSVGRVQALEPLKDQHPAEYAVASDQLFKAKAFQSALNGMVMEIDNLIGLYDAAVVNFPDDDNIDPNRPLVMEKLAMTYQNGITPVPSKTV